MCFVKTRKLYICFARCLSRRSWSPLLCRWWDYLDGDSGSQVEAQAVSNHDVWFTLSSEWLLLVNVIAYATQFSCFSQMRPELDQNLTLFWSQVSLADMINGLMKTQMNGQWSGWVGGDGVQLCPVPFSQNCLSAFCVYLCICVRETFVSVFHWYSDETQQGERASNEREGVGPRTLQ